MKFNKRLLFLLLAIILGLVLTACGSEEASKKEEEVKEEEKTDEKSNEEKEDEKKEEDKEISSATMTDGEIFNPAIEEQSGGTVEHVFTNNNPGYENDIDGLHVKVNGYQIVKVTDANESEKYILDDSLEGYVVTADVTIENTLDKDVKFNAGMFIQLEDRYNYVQSNMNYYIPEDKKIKWENSDDFGTYEPGSIRNGYVTFSMTTDEYERLQQVEPKFVIEAGASFNDDFSDSFGNDAVFDFVYSAEQGEKVASAPKFYQDQLTTENIATKEMIFEDLDLNESQELDKFKLTIEGVQYTTITPNETSKERFSNFGDDELVAMTLKINIDNQSDVLVYNGTGGILVANDNEARILNQGMVENTDKREINPGETAEHYMVFLFEKKYFDIYEEFSLEIGPFLGEDGYVLKERK
ncbi:DUF5068 domain-containing protein [Ornithinibacillus scapharcae]|uniref:DUF5068 domain-containing protein n=1 Tax=Ornithinibacillus scapharcae TaxID=1147159 RepID=UPI000225BAD3|nr:DUF5068 domain-containing protein [Ornithinibacillus scapharcae]